MGESFDYAAEFKSLDLRALKKDIAAVLTTSAYVVSGMLPRWPPRSASR